MVSFHSKLDTISTKKNAYVQRASAHEFSVAHYTGKVTYDVRNMADKNRDFLPPEMVCIVSFYFDKKFNLRYRFLSWLFYRWKLCERPRMKW